MSQPVLGSPKLNHGTKRALDGYLALAKPHTSLARWVPFQRKAVAASTTIN